jgi:hypothetical protein
VDIIIAADGNVFPSGDPSLPGTVTDLAGIRSVVTATGTRALDGNLANLLIDISQAAIGEYRLALVSDDGGFTTAFANVSGPIPSTLGAATIRIVPEPASVLMLLGALPFLRRRSA